MPHILCREIKETLGSWEEEAKNALEDDKPASLSEYDYAIKHHIAENHRAELTESMSRIRSRVRIPDADENQNQQNIQIGIDALEELYDRLSVIQRCL